MCSYYTKYIYLSQTLSGFVFKFLACVFYPFMVGWAFQALLSLFKCLTRGIETKRLRRGVSPSSEIKGIFPMKCCAVTWKSLCLLYLLIPTGPFKQHWKLWRRMVYQEKLCTCGLNWTSLCVFNSLLGGFFCDSLRSTFPQLWIFSLFHKPSLLLL